MKTEVKLFSKSIAGGTLTLAAVFGIDRGYLTISGHGGALDDFHTEYFRDINAAVRAFNHRSRTDGTSPDSHTWIHHLSSITSGDTVSAPVAGLREFLELIDPKSAFGKSLTYRLAPWNDAYDINASDEITRTIPTHGLTIRRERTAEGHELGLHLTDHPATAMKGRNRFVLRLASLKGDESNPTEENIEYFYDTSLAFMAFDRRLANDSADPTRLGMEGGTSLSHFEHRNSILVEDAVSIGRSEGDEICRLMIAMGQFEECDGLYYKLNDANAAAYSGNLVKWLGSVTVHPDGSGIYSKGRTKPFEMHIHVEIPPTEIERSEDGSIDFALCYFSGYYNHEDWHEAPDFRDLPYTDAGVENSVNEFLSGLGLKGTVAWSEHGRQNAEQADFDMDYGLIDELWPELRAAHTPTASPSV